MDSSGVRFGTSGVRGLVVEMSSQVCFAYTTAFLGMLPRACTRVALAVDLRPSSPEIAAACAAAIRHAGLEIDFCGALPTPALAFYAQSQALPAIMVTGSHIPFDRNGIKFYSAAGEITKAEEARISASVVRIPLSGLSGPLPDLSGTAYRNYVDRYVDFFPSGCLSGMKVGVYEHSSVARDLLKDLLGRLGAQIISLGRTDAFVPIDTEAVSQDDQRMAREWAQQYAFDALVSTDGDADRPLVGDENGRWFRGDIVGLLCARYLGAQAVVTTVSCNTALELCGAFASVLRTRIGSPYVIEGIEQLLRSGASRVVGFEPNGGFLVGAGIEKSGRALSPLMTRDAVLPMLCLLAMSREQGVSLSALSASLPGRYTASDRLQNFSGESSRFLLQALTSRPAALETLFDGLCGQVVARDQTDGLRLTLAGQEIVHFRPSGNAPELRCYAEAATQARAEFLVSACLHRVAAFTTEEGSRSC